MSAHAEEVPVDPNHQSVLHFAGEGPVHRAVFSHKGKLVRDMNGIETVHELGVYVTFLTPVALDIRV